MKSREQVHFAGFLTELSNRKSISCCGVFPRIGSRYGFKSVSEMDESADTAASQQGRECRSTSRMDRECVSGFGGVLEGNLSVPVVRGIRASKPNQVCGMFTYDAQHAAIFADVGRVQ